MVATTSSRDLLGHSRSVRALALSPVSPFTLFSGSDDFTVRTWDARDRLPVAVSIGHGSAVRSLAACPDGTVCSGSFFGEIKRWHGASCLSTFSTSTGNSYIRGTSKMLLLGLTRELDDQRALTATTSHSTGFAQAWCECAVVGLTLAPDGNLYSASRCGALRRWMDRSGYFQPIYPEDTYETLCGSELATCLAHIPADENPTAAESAGGTLMLGNIGKPQRPYSFSSTADLSKIIPSYRAWQTGSRLVGMHKFTEAKPIPNLAGVGSQHVFPVNSLCVDTRNRVIYAGASNGMILAFSGRTAPKVFATDEPETGQVLCLALGPEGTGGVRKLFSGSADGHIRVWNTISGQCQASVPAHLGRVTSLALVPDGSGTGYSAGADGVIKEWALQ